MRHFHSMFLSLAAAALMVSAAPALAALPAAVDGEELPSLAPVLASACAAR